MSKQRLIGFSLLVSLAGLMILYFWEALAQPNLMVERDLPIFFFPSLKLWVEALKAGELPLWNPYVFSGQPLFASLQTAILYPPNLVFFILPLDFGFNFTIALHFFLSGWFVYLLCRELGGSRPAGILACLAFSLGGFLISIHNVLNTLQSVTWAPLLFYFFLRTLSRKSWKYAVFSALTILVQFLGGGIEVFLLTQVMVLFLGFYPQALLPEQPFASWRWRLLSVGLIYLLFVGLGAVQILPFWEMAANSSRQLGFSYSEATRWSLNWKDLFYLFLPDLFWRGVEYYQKDQNYLKSIYLGIIPLVMVSCFFLGRDRRKGWFGLILLMSFLLALGGNTPFYWALFTFVPGVENIRYPVKFLFLALLFIGLLTGLGWDRLTQRLLIQPQQKDGVLKKISLALALFSVIILLGLSLFRVPITAFLDHSFPISYARPWVFNLHNLERFFFFAMLFFLFLLFFSDGKVTLKWAPSILVVLLVLDLFLANWAFYRRVDQKAFYTLSPNLEAVLSHSEKGRIYVDPLMFKTKVPKAMEMVELTYFILKECFYLDYPLIHRIYNTAGFGVMTYRPYQDLLTILQEKASGPQTTDLLRLLNGRFILWHEAINDPAFQLIRKGESYILAEEPFKTGPYQPPRYRIVTAHLYENRSVLPRAFLASHYRVVKNEQERMALFKKKAFDPARTLLLEETPDAPQPNPGPVPEREKVRIVKQTLNRLDLEVSAPGPRLLFISETWYPGWKVWVNGHKGKVYRANHALRAIPVGPGNHTIQFLYDPWTLNLGLVISLITLAGLFFFLSRWKGDSFSKQEP